ncbi:hypothetical protein N9D40_01260 [bacterium]|nr:hypothetical protein [bacterium]
MGRSQAAIFTGIGMAVLGLAGCGPQMLKIPPNLGILKKWDSTEFSVSIDSPHFVQGLHNGRNSLINAFSANKARAPARFNTKALSTSPSSVTEFTLRRTEPC